MRISLRQKKNIGYAMLLTAVIFMLVSLVIVFGLATPIINQIAASRDIWGEKQSYYLSEAGVEDVLYRLKDASFSQYVSPVESITLGGYGATTTSSGSITGVGGLTVATLSDVGGYEKKIAATVTQGAGVSFTYGVQVGTGGIVLNSSTITGNVYSAGPIVATNETAKITGSAIVSDSASDENQANDSPASPPDSITFGNANGTQDAAQSFQVTSSVPVEQVSLYLEKNGSPASITVDIVKDKNGAPSKNSGDILGSGTLNSSLVTSSYGWVNVSLSSNPSLTPGTTYWIVLDASTGSASKDYVLGANLDTNYASGTSKTGSLSGGSWSNTGYDAYFRVYLGGGYGSISGIGQYNPIYVGTTGSDMAWAHDASYVQVTGPLRCQTDTLNNKACDTSYADPSSASYPVSDGNIAEWKSEAAAGGSMGSYTLPNGTATLGPVEINGNLVVEGGGTLTVTGTIYVTGTVTVTGGGTVKLASSYGSGSGIIVTDGAVSVSGGSYADGSGQSGSYLMIVTTSDCDGSSLCGGAYAIKVSGGSGAVILNAQNGTMYLSGGVNVNEATADKLILSGGSNVTYQAGLANPNFSSGPSGGFTIANWQEEGN